MVGQYASEDSQAYRYRKSRANANTIAVNTFEVMNMQFQIR